MARPSPSPHKPRRRPRIDQGKLSKSELLVRAPAFPLSSFLWPARGAVSQWEVLPLVLMVSGLFRWAAGLWGYSGTCLVLAPPSYNTRSLSIESCSSAAF